VTGSERAGAAVAAAAGQNLKKVVLELGGSDPFIVLDGARPAGGGQDGRRGPDGERRAGLQRVQADDRRGRRVRRLPARIHRGYVRLRDRRSHRPGHQLRPLSSEQAAQNLMAQIEDAVSRGATVRLGGRRIDGPGAFVEPTVLTDVTPDMRAFREELFGPAAVVYRVADADAAVELANSSAFGLGGTVFSSDEQLAMDVADQLEVGMVWINTAELGGPSCRSAAPSGPASAANSARSASTSSSTRSSSTPRPALTSPAGLPLALAGDAAAPMAYAREQGGLGGRGPGALAALSTILAGYSAHTCSCWPPGPRASPLPPRAGRSSLQARENDKLLELRQEQLNHQQELKQRQEADGHSTGAGLTRTAPKSCTEPR